MKISLLAMGLAALIPVQLHAQGIEPGTYSGSRGWYHPKGDCAAYYPLQVHIDYNRISFSSDGRYWSGTINMATGELYIPDTGVTPPTRYSISIIGHYRNATMRSDYCGEGYFRLD